MEEKQSGMVERRNRGMPAAELIGDTTMAHFSTSWIRRTACSDAAGHHKLVRSILGALVIILAIGAMPWRIGISRLNFEGGGGAPEPCGGHNLANHVIVIPAYGFYLGAMPIRWRRGRSVYGHRRARMGVPLHRTLAVLSGITVTGRFAADDSLDGSSPSVV